MEKSLINVSSKSLEAVNPLQQFLAGQLTTATKKAYQTDVRLFLDHCNISVNELLQLDINQIYNLVTEYRNHISTTEEGTSFISNASTVARKMTSLNVFFNFLVKLEYFRRNPISEIKSPSVPTDSTSEALTLSEIKSVFSVIDNSTVKGIRDKAILSIMYNLGLRRSEVAKLKFKDLSSSGDFRIITIVGKRNKKRILPLKPEVIEHIRQYLTATGRDFDSDGFVFLSHSNRNNGQQNITTGTIWFMLKKYLKEARISKKISPHSFRHTAVTLALDNGASYREVMNMTGHSDSRLVARYDRGDKLKNNATWKLPSIN